MLSSPVCDLAPELQTSEIPEGFMKHPVLEVRELQSKWFPLYVDIHDTQKGCDRNHEPELRIIISKHAWKKFNFAGDSLLMWRDISLKGWSISGLYPTPPSRPSEVFITLVPKLFRRTSHILKYLLGRIILHCNFLDWRFSITLCTLGSKF